MSGISGWLAATVRRTDNATPYGRVLHLDIPDWPGNLPGQHLDLRLTAEDGYQAVRSYSIASFGPAPAVEIAVDEIETGEVSPYLVEDVLPGDELEVRGPIGRYFVWRETQSEPVQLIAGGSGIVPLVSIVRAHRTSASPASFRLLYSVRAPQDALYADELSMGADDRFALSWVYTRSAPPRWPGPTGRVSTDTLMKHCIPVAEGPLVYVCGPTGFVEAVADGLVRLGHDPARIRTERFGGS